MKCRLFLFLIFLTTALLGQRILFATSGSFVEEHRVVIPRRQAPKVLRRVQEVNVTDARNFPKEGATWWGEPSQKFESPSEVYEPGEKLKTLHYIEETYDTPGTIKSDVSTDLHEEHPYVNPEDRKYIPYLRNTVVPEIRANATN